MQHGVGGPITGCEHANESRDACGVDPVGCTEPLREQLEHGGHLLLEAVAGKMQTFGTGGLEVSIEARGRVGRGAQAPRVEILQVVHLAVGETVGS